MPHNTSLPSMDTSLLSKNLIGTYALSSNLQVPDLHISFWGSPLDAGF